MNSTSRVLGEDELASVTPVWWRDNPTPVPAENTLAVQVYVPADGNGAGSGASVEGTDEREAYRKGLAEGTAIGKEQAAMEVQPVLDRLAHTLVELSSLRSRIRRDAEKDLLKLAVAIARRVLHREMTTDPESIEGLIKVALEKLQSRDLCRVRVHPNHAAFMNASFDRISNSKKIDLVADGSLRCGDVLFETEHGTLDASIESQLSEIERGFADRLQR
jgi:flagellar assembly protein FliH